MNRNTKYFKERKYLYSLFPKRNSFVKIEDFFQIEVDDFNDGYFIFKKVKRVNLEYNKKLVSLIEIEPANGYIVECLCRETNWYTGEYYFMPYKILVCEYKSLPWKNNYNICAALSEANNCDGYCVQESIENFAEWMKPIKINN